MRRLVLRICLSYAALAAFYLLVFRLRSRPVIDEVRVFNTKILNPAMMRLAGRRHWYSSAIRHEGRRSGKEYATPVVAVPVAGSAFVIPLPYGEDVDWLKNVLAAGRATIKAKGETYGVVEPEVIDAAEALSVLDERHRRAWWLFGIKRFLRVKRTYRDLAAPSGASLEQRLQVFRRTHPYRESEADGLRWRYVVGGRGERTILLPSGGTRVPDMYLLLFETLEPEFRLISPAYPTAHTMDALVKGIAAVLDAEGVEKVDLLGSSFGGFVAQCFVRRYPKRVRSLILANTGAPGTRPLPGLPLLVHLFALLPEGVVRRATGWNWRRWFVVPPEKRAFWHGLIDELLTTRLTKADLVSALEEMLDYSRYNFDPRDLADWPGQILVIESEHDKAFSPDARAALRALYPQARVRTFAGSGHAVMINGPSGVPLCRKRVPGWRERGADVMYTHGLVG